MGGGGGGLILWWCCSLAHNKFDEASFEKFCETLATMRGIQTLDVSCCGIHHGGAVLLAAALTRVTSITSLAICADPLEAPFVCIGAVGTVAFAQLLRRPRCQIKELW